MFIAGVESLSLQNAGCGGSVDGYANGCGLGATVWARLKEVL